jgi:acyl-CoA thioesterase-1
MRTWQPLIARFAIGGGLVWCAPSQSVQPPTAGAAAVAVHPLEVESRDARAPGVLPPNPLVSRSKRVVGWSSLQFPHLPNINDGDYSTSWGAGRPTPDQPAWVAIDVGAGPRRVLVNWSSGGSYNYEETDYGSPGAYRIETSGDSTDGVNGTWRTVVDVLRVSTHGLAHSFDFDGQRWVKLVVTGTPAQSPNGVQISEVDVHDVSAGAEDSWFFVGDSITALAFNRTPAHQPSFAAWVNRRRGEYFPAMIDGGHGGDKSDEGATRIGECLLGNPDVHFWAIAFGTNDAAGNASETTRFRRNMETIVNRVREAGRLPILATIPFASDGQHENIPSFNRALEEIRAANALAPGPDLYAWFVAHPDELQDGVHPSDRGVVSINRLWAEAVAALYPR